MVKRSRHQTYENATNPTYLLDAVHKGREASSEVLVCSLSAVLNHVVKHTHSVPPADKQRQPLRRPFRNDKNSVLQTILLSQCLPKLSWRRAAFNDQRPPQRRWLRAGQQGSEDGCGDRVEDVEVGGAVPLEQVAKGVHKVLHHFLQTVPDRQMTDDRCPCFPRFIHNHTPAERAYPRIHQRTEL